MKSLPVEIISNAVRNALFNILYRPPNGLIDLFESFLKEIFISNKMYHISGDFNLDHENFK